MNTLRSRLLLVTILLALTCGALLPLYQKQGQKEWTEKDLSIIPATIGDWQGEDVEVDQETRDLLESDAVLVRKYTRGERSVWLALVYYGDNRVALHLPENCSIGQGTTILTRTGVSIPVADDSAIQANRLLVQGRRAVQMIVYYFQAGDFITPSYLGMRWRMITNFLQNTSSSGAFIRYSIVVQNGEEEAFKTLSEFASLAAPILRSELQQ